MKKGLPIFSLALLAALTLAGLAAIAWQTLNGLVVTALREPTAWGLYVVGFAYFFGIGAGSLTIAGAAVASRREEYRETARIAAPLAMVALALAGLMITLDMGRPERAWMVLMKAQFQSPLVMDFLVLNLLIALAFVLTYVTIRKNVLDHGPESRSLLSLPFRFGHGSKPERLFYRLTPRLAAATAVATPFLYLLTVRVFSSLQARMEWHSTLLAPSFLVSAMLAGTGAIGLAMAIDDANFARRPATLLWRRLAIGLIAVAMIMQISPFLTMRQFDSPPTLAYLGNSGMALVIEITLGLALPSLLICIGRNSRFRLGTASVLLLAGVFLKRWQVIVPAMNSRSLPLPDNNYFPNLIEIGATVGVTAGALLVLVILLTFFNPRVKPQAADGG